MGLSKKDSLSIKGIAILTMMLHHCFLRKADYDTFDISFWPLNQGIVTHLAVICKVCVALFVFVSGYGLAISVRNIEPAYRLSAKQTTEYLIRRIISVLSGFWFVMVLLCVVCQLIDGRTVSIYFSDGIKDGLINLVISFFGLSELFGTAQLVGTWWYMSLALLLVVLVPVIGRIANKCGYFLVILGCIMIPRIFALDNNFVRWTLTLVAGMMFADFDLFSKLQEYMLGTQKMWRKIVKWMVLTLALAACYKFYMGPMELRFTMIPLIIICYSYLYIIHIPVLRVVLQFLGKHAMNVFLIHTLFRNYYLHNWVYGMGHFLLTCVVLLGVALVASIAVELLKKLLRYDTWISGLQNKMVSLFVK